MKWRNTLILVAAGLLLAFLIWRWESAGERSADTPRSGEGYLYPWSNEGLLGVEIVYPERSFLLERENASAPWEMTSPLRDAVDEDVLTKLLATLEAQKVERWLAPRPRADWGEMGLAAPKLEIRLRREGRRDTLSFGDLNEVERRLWLAVSWQDSLALVSTLLRTNLMLGYYELLSKKPFHDISLTRVESLEIQNARGAYRLGRCPWGWEIRRPEPYLTDTGRIRDLLGELFGKTILDFVQDPEPEPTLYGFDAPRATVRVKLAGEERPRILELGSSMHRLHYARYLDRDQVYLLRDEAAQMLTESFSNFMSLVLCEFLTGQVLEVGGHGDLRLIRDMDQDWEWHDQAGRKLPDAALVSLLTRLGRLSTERVAAMLPRADQTRLWGLDAPEQVYHLRLKGDLGVTIEIGAVHEGRRYFRRGDYPTVYSLPAEEVDLGWPEPL